MTNKSSVEERLKLVEKELAELKERSAALKAHWILEKDFLGGGQMF